MNRFWEARLNAWNVQVLPGELHVTEQDEVITTVLGSCVSACIRDTTRPIGGMNHFMLPRAPRQTDEGAPGRYGVYALELLLNRLLRGSRREDLAVKVFGGGRVLEGGTDIGRTNIAFVREFFAVERIPIIAEDVGDRFARRLRFWPLSGRIQLLRMPMANARKVIEQENVTASTLAPVAGSVELF